MGAATPPPTAAPDGVSIARLHGEACWWCGAVNTGLRPIGEVSTAVDGGIRLWPVVACRQHAGRELAGPARQPMLSTQVPSATGRPAYIVHPAGADVPATAPACPADCPTCRGRD